TVPASRAWFRRPDAVGIPHDAGTPFVLLWGMVSRSSYVSAVPAVGESYFVRPTGSAFPERALAEWRPYLFAQPAVERGGVEVTEVSVWLSPERIELDVCPAVSNPRPLLEFIDRFLLKWPCKLFDQFGRPMAIEQLRAGITH